MKISAKVVFLALLLSCASLASLYAIDVSQLKYENGALTLDGAKLQFINTSIAGASVLYTKASDVVSINIESGTLTIVAKERTITIIVSNILCLNFSTKDSTLWIYV
jgi:hypothetical protein